jgi:hypothetical protein
MIIHRDIIQGTDEWLELRKLKLTASHATAIGNQGKGLKTYIDDLLLYSFIEKDFQSSKDTERGHRLEPTARIAYEFEKGYKVEEIGFVERCKNSGFSPDGWIQLEKELGLLECKARNDKKHFAILRTGKVDSSTIWQMNMGMFISKADWCDFISFNPNFKKALFIKRFYPCEKKQNAIKEGLEMGIGLLLQGLEEEAVKYELS